jgi:predicted Kef-type K+ transport protein
MHPGIVDTAWITVAFFCGFLARAINLPPLIGFLAAGFILNYLGLQQAGAALSEIAELGVTLLLFTIGLKLDIKSLLRPEIWLGTSVHMLSSTLGIAFCLLGLAATPLLGPLGLSTAVLVGFALAFSSTVFAVKTLEDKAEIKSFHGVTAVGILIMQDIIAVIFLTFSAGKVPSVWALALPLLLLLRPLLFRLLDASGHGELLNLFGLFLALVFGALSFELVGLKADLGALAAGVLVAPHPKAKELAKSLMSFKDLFLIGFFLQIGLSGLPTVNLTLLALILVLLALFKGIFFFLLLPIFQLRARTALFTALPLANFSEFGLLVASIGAQNGWLGTEWLVCIALALSFSFIIGAPLNSGSHRLYSRLKHQLKRVERAGRHPADEPIDLQGADVIIFGMGRVGLGAFEYANTICGRKVIGIDANTKRVQQCVEAGRNVIFGDATDIDFWDKLNPAQVDLIMLAMSKHAANLNAAIQLRAAGYTGLLSATVFHDDEEQQLLAAGVDTTYNFYADSGASFADHTRKTLLQKRDTTFLAPSPHSPDLS